MLIILEAVLVLMELVAEYPLIVDVDEPVELLAASTNSIAIYYVMMTVMLKKIW